MSPQQLNEILQRYHTDQCTEQERHLVEEWFSSMGKEELEIDVHSQSQLQKRLWIKIQSGNKTKDVSNYWRLTSTAAAILVLIVSGIVLAQYFAFPGNQIGTTHQSPALRRIINSSAVAKRIELNDGSWVSLQPGTEFEFPDVFDDEREVYLTGEAFFDVEKDSLHPFIIYTHEVTTKVLGTSFSIKGYPGEKHVTVAVKAGRVSVSAITADKNSRVMHQEVILTPNQEVIYDRNEKKVLKKLVDDPQVITPPASIKTSFTNAPVIEIFNALQKSYGVVIEYDAQALSACTLTFDDITREGLFEQIEIICHALGASYTTSEFLIRIEAKGCK